MFVKKVELVNGGKDPQRMSRGGLEASLDMQYALALAHPVPVVFQSTGGRGAKLDGNGKPTPEERAELISPAVDAMPRCFLVYKRSSVAILHFLPRYKHVESRASVPNEL